MRQEVGERHLLYEARGETHLALNGRLAKVISVCVRPRTRAAAASSPASSASSSAATSRAAAGAREGRGAVRLLVGAVGEGVRRREKA